MALRARILPFLFVLVGCGKDFPPAWQDYGLPRDHLVSAFMSEYGASKGHELVAIYSAEAKLPELVSAWDAALGAKGLSQQCTVDHEDGSFTRGYGSLPEKRYRLAASPVGDAAHELHLLEVPEHVPDAEVCPKTDD